MIAIRADYNAIIGMGHMMRCISIANELQKNGEEICFIVSSDSGVAMLNERKIPYYKLNNTSSTGWDGAEVAKWMISNHCRKILIDTYRISSSDFDSLREIAEIIYIDDLYAFDYNCSMIVNYNIEATCEKYANSKYNPVLLLGTEYFPLRDEFCSQKNSIIRKNVKSVLITTGSTDDYHISRNIMEVLSSRYIDIDFNVLIGPFYADEYVNSLIELQKYYKNINLVSWGQNMAVFIKKHDIVIAPGSTIIFEALSMNVPCISFEFVDNHHEQCVAMEKEGMVPYVGDFKQPDLCRENLIRIFHDELLFENRSKRAEIFNKKFDKKGSERIADALRRI